MNVKELFGGEIGYPYDVIDNMGHRHRLMIYLRRIKADEETEFVRRIQTQRILENGKLEPTDTSVNAGVWLFNRLRTRVLLSNGDGNMEEVAREDESHVVDDATKKDAVAQHRNRIKKAEDQQLQD